MRFGVVVCPKCRKAKAADLSFKTTKCIRCNYIIDISKTKVLYKTDSQLELRQALGKINAELDKDNTKFH